MIVDPRSDEKLLFFDQPIAIIDTNSNGIRNAALSGSLLIYSVDKYEPGILVSKVECGEKGELEKYTPLGKLGHGGELTRSIVVTGNYVLIAEFGDHLYIY